MKKIVKVLLMAFSVCATSAFAVVTSGCDIKQKIDELRCEHVLIDGEVTKEPTCTEEGEMIKECTLCSYTETVALESFGHIEVVIPAVASTCTTSGKTEGKQCGVCGDILEAQTVVTPKGHSPLVIEAVAPTCTDEGKKEGYRCSDCGIVLVEQETIPAKGHSPVVDEAIASTCTTTGLTEGSHCGDCGEILVAQKQTDVKAHAVTQTGSYEATCEAPAFSGGLKCENCDYVESGEYVGEALGHILPDLWTQVKAPTCTEEGEEKRVCSRDNCEYIENRVIPALGHTETSVTVAPTCSEQGYTTYTCSVCGNVENRDLLNALGHSDDDGVIITLATCAVEGEMKFTCTTCNREYTVSIPTVAHKFENGTCTVCGIDEQQLFTFTVIVTDAGGGVMGSYTSTATKGSSWAEWVASTNFEIAHGGAPIVTNNNLVRCPGGDNYYLKEAAGYNSRSITADEIIQENTVYYFVSKSP